MRGKRKEKKGGKKKIGEKRDEGYDGLGRKGKIRRGGTKTS